ncbi:MAG: hypothetical protein MK135_12655, partial [Polyangiaceae bacterium]|nr:hypothetical protein [Polyangiaceae bacterium]
QTYANFSVGGSLSVNAHGRYRERGPIVHSVENIRLVLANGKVVDADRKKNSELFFGAIGGYGGLGVISEATLRLTENHPVQRITKVMPTSDHPEFFSSNIQKNTLATFYNADLHPPQYDTLRAVVWQKTDAELTNQERLIPRDEEYAWTARLLEASLTWPGGAKLRQHIMEPIAYASSPITTRNHEASYDVAELEPSSREDHTYVLQEYFVPVDKFTAFVPKMAAIFRKHEAEIINVSLRHAKSDPDTLLSWAPEEVFAYVVYYRQPTTEEGAEAVRRWTKEMADLLIEMQGAWYLPYQVHASREQFLQAYPRAPELFRLKKKFDPAYRFRGALWGAYYRPRSSTASQSRTQKTNQQDSQLTLDTPRLRSHEARTYLSIPEWYLVFQPRHYAEFLRRGGSSTDYSWADALTQYYSHEKRARTLAQPYPKDTEYEEILSVIGPSTAVEYLTKSLYESTLGALFQHTGDEQGSDEARLIADAHRSYGEFILDQPWYRFSFYPWVEKIDQLDSQNRDSSLRRFERKTIFKIEFTLKALYARVLEKLTESMPPAVEEIEVEASLPKKRSIASIKDVRVLQARDPLLKTSTLSVPRWSAFSLRMQELAEAGANFTTISGGGAIAVSLISDKHSAPPSHARLLYRQPLASAKSLHALAPESEDDALATWEGKERQVALVPVQDLGVFLRSLHGETHRLEHLYDY